MADLLFHYPVRYSDISEVKNLRITSWGYGHGLWESFKIKNKKGYRSKIPMAEGEIADLSGKIKIIWFNQAYLAKMIRGGESVKLTGRVTQNKSGIYLANPEFEKLGNLPIDSHDTLFRPPRLSGTPPSQGRNIWVFPIPFTLKLEA